MPKASKGGIHIQRDPSHLVQVVDEVNLLLEGEAIHVNAKVVLVVTVEVLGEAVHQAVYEVH